MKKLVALVLACLFALSTAGGVAAKITEVPISCANPSGNEPGGQQPQCKNTKLTQTSENQNPSGKAPPGQNP